VFLAGEVVSEYSLRLKRELDGARVWVNAYANSLPCYIPSKRMYPEGGYEVDGSMDYYGWPTRLAIETEDRIIETVHALVPPEFKRPGPGRRAQ
jgi:neutral ceramidase